MSKSVASSVCQEDAEPEPERLFPDYEFFMPCKLAECCVKVPDMPPRYDFATFMEHEDLIARLYNEEVKNSLESGPGSELPQSPPKAELQINGKMVTGPVHTAGYNAARSDFDVEYDNYAEQLLGDFDDPLEPGVYPKKEDQDVCDALQVSLVSMYNNRVKERLWRKRVVRDHGLIDSRKAYNFNQRLVVPFGKTTLLSLLKFIRFLTGPQLDFIVESLLHQISLKRKLGNLLNYRNHGIRFKSGIKIYENLNKKHLKNFSELQHDGLSILAEIVGSSKTSRRPTAPLVLHNLPGYNLLDEDEKQLCSMVRIVPETYHNFKQLLVNECKKHDGLKLATARQVIKIDVNKTRKMYDFLKNRNLIWAPNT
ncbi:SWIRM domain [Nesidiocoris tenuis]|uniref:SWIRM domain n=1 Tax=Nesidiocoris tenuis TaxID=355587 RepID=A0ABN7B4M2_9HEMI|nr:SWIRM domain [Nesidiocoris tenuis]